MMFCVLSINDLTVSVYVRNIFLFLNFRRVPQESWLTTPFPQEQSAVGRNPQKKKPPTTSRNLTPNLKLKPVKHSVFLKKLLGTTQKRVSLSGT